MSDATAPAEAPDVDQLADAADTIDAPANRDEQHQPPRDDEQEQGKGSKAAVLADLAKERDTRQALEAKLAAVAKLFNPDADDVDPVKAAEQYQADARQARTELAVFRVAGTLGADPDTLLDSASFLKTLDGIDPTDSAAVTAAVQAALDTSPRYRAANPAAGARDAAAGNRATTSSADTEALRVLGF